MLSSELELCLNEAFQSARERRHEFMTVEHLLLALTDIPQVQEILTACGGNVDELRGQLTDFIDTESPLMATCSQRLDFRGYYSAPCFASSPAARRR